MKLVVTKAAVISRPECRRHEVEGYRGLISNASDVNRLSNATETSIMLCGKAQPPLVGRAGIEPQPPAPKARPLKDWAIWTFVISHRYQWAMDILTTHKYMTKKAKRNTLKQIQQKYLQ